MYMHKTQVPTHRYYMQHAIGIVRTLQCILGTEVPIPTYRPQGQQTYGFVNLFYGEWRPRISLHLPRNICTLFFS